MQQLDKVLDIVVPVIWNVIQCSYTVLILKLHFMTLTNDFEGQGHILFNMVDDIGVH